MSLRLLVTAHGDPQEREFPYDFDDDRAQILLGRRGGVDVLLPHAGVSLVHARIERRPGGYFIVDDGSTGGTTVNGQRLDSGVERALRQGDRVGIAEFLVEIAEVEGGVVLLESSLSIARRMVSEVLGVLGPGAQHPALTLLGDDASLPLDPERLDARLDLVEPGRAYVVGRASGSDLVLGDLSVAPQHVRLVRGEGAVVASDLGSPHGLYVNDKFVGGERALRDGDVLSVGRARLRYADPAEVYLRRLEQSPAAGAPITAPVALDTTLPRAAERGLVATRQRGEWMILVGSGVVALGAVAGLLYLWLT